MSTPIVATLRPVGEMGYARGKSPPSHAFEAGLAAAETRQAAHAFALRLNP